jgi:plastocyanin
LMHAMNIKKPAALHAQVGNFVTWVWNNQCLRNDALWQRTRNVDFINITVSDTVKPAQVVTSIKQLPVFKGHLFH